MEFNVLFISTNGFPIEIESREIGLTGLEFIRENTCPKLDLNRITGEMFARRESTKVKVPEETARKSGLFSQKNTITVVVPAGFLNDFCEWCLDSNKSTKTGEVYSASILWKKNTTKILEWWESAVFPLEVKEEETEVRNSQES